MHDFTQKKLTPKNRWCAKDAQDFLALARVVFSWEGSRSAFARYPKPRQPKPPRVNLQIKNESARNSATKNRSARKRAPLKPGLASELRLE